MKVSYQSLKQYVDFPWSPEELGDQLTMAGMEVEKMETIPGAFEGIVVAEIVENQKHPNADKLSVCRVQDGRGTRQIVCGATNYRVGDKVPLALPGARLPDTGEGAPITIKVAKMRGVESQGMLCSAKELGLAEDAEGLFILAETARVGQSLAEHLGRSGTDYLYDLEITPNRPDLNSVIGIAREVSALTGNTLVLPGTSADPSAAPETTLVEQWVSVNVEAPDLCPRYVARIITGVRIGPSPDWLRESVEKAGFRSINNVVDITNFVMWETGQPLHAFDYDLLGRSGGGAAAESLPGIVVRRAEPAEQFVTLDGQTRSLSPEMLLIADRTRPIALAGVMGGQNSEIQPATKNVLLESAYFDPANIRATSRKLGLRTDAAYRFERGVDLEFCDWASRRAAQLMAELAGGQIITGAIDVYFSPWEPAVIGLRHARVNQLLGVEISDADQIEYLRRLRFDLCPRFPGSDPAAGAGHSAPPETPPRVNVQVPHFRSDVKGENDLIEEIGRLYGVDRIPASPPASGVGAHPFDATYDQMQLARQLLTGLGFTEIQGQTLLHEGAIPAGILSSPEGQPSGGTRQPCRLENPISADMNALRPSLIPGLLAALRHNAHHRIHDLGLFEIGHVFINEGRWPSEGWRAALAVTGDRQPAFWDGQDRDRQVDLYDLKGILETFLDRYDVRGISFAKASGAHDLYFERGTIELGKDLVGHFGQLQPALAKACDLRKPVFIAELNLDLLLARRKPARSFKPLPAFPAVRRDIAMLLPEEITHKQVLEQVKAARVPHVEQVELFDIFRGHSVPPGQKSMAYAFTYRHAERTLTDAEVNAMHEKLVTWLKQKLPAIIRD